jgi:hypothetical protein
VFSLCTLPELLILGCAVLGATHALTSDVRKHRLGNNVVALVGSSTISKSDLDTAMRDVTLDLEPRSTAALRSEILGKLIEEELLFQFGFDHRLYERDEQIRLAVVRTMFTLACSGASAAPTPGGEAVGYGNCVEYGSAAGQRAINSYVEWLRNRADVRVTALR